MPIMTYTSLGACQLSRHVEAFDVQERSIRDAPHHIRIICAVVTRVDTEQRVSLDISTHMRTYVQYN
jgi:hypothetical protein